MLPTEIKSKKGERWLPVVEGRYWVSNKGRVASKSMQGTRILKPDKLYIGHLRVTFCIGGKTYRRMVHHLVLEAFVRPRPDGLDCCHNNGDPADNRVENLRWDTKRANEADKVRHGTRAIGTRHGRSKLTPVKVREIRRRYIKGVFGTKRLGKIYGVDPSCIACVVKGKTWGWMK